jgi:glycosyltransferase involved in cell wall biosynthesis
LHSRFSELVRIERLGHFLPEPPAEDVETNGGRPYFLYAGRLESIKGVDRLVEVFRGRPEELLVAGTGTEEKRLRRAAAGVPNVRFLGWLPAERLGPLYRGARALVLPTLGHESFPLVVLEAFARGVPVAARRFGAQAELLEESGGGLSYLSDAELGDALDRLAGDGELRRDLGERGRAAWAERWTPEVHLEGYMGLIEDLRRGTPETAGRARRLGGP